MNDEKDIYKASVVCKNSSEYFCMEKMIAKSILRIFAYKETTKKIYKASVVCKNSSSRGDFLRDPALPGGDGAKRGNQFFARGIFQHVTLRAGLMAR